MLHESAWRKDISSEQARKTLDAFERAPIRERRPKSLGSVAWQVADDLGFAKTHDAEFLALAQILGCRLVTLDKRLLRGAARLGDVVDPAQAMRR